EAVQRVYEAYGRADMEAALAEVADDVDWAAEAASTSVPWFGSHRGKGEVARFFKEIGSNIEVTEFTPLSFASNETDVVATVRWARARLVSRSRPRPSHSVSAEPSGSAGSWAATCSSARRNVADRSCALWSNGISWDR